MNAHIDQLTDTNHFLGLIARCKDEPYVEEFCNYYINQGVDEIILIDDNSNDKKIYQSVLHNKKISIIYTQLDDKINIFSDWIEKLRVKFEWVIYVDIDEYITTKKTKCKTIREELATTFKHAHCIKVPWVMMSCNSLINNPDSILNTIVHRWDHDKKHPPRDRLIHKFRCRYDNIESKCIFRPKYFDSISSCPGADHHPHGHTGNNKQIREGVYNSPTLLNPFYRKLREIDITTGHLLCYHYRIISKQHCEAKLRTNKWYKKPNFTVNDLMNTDYPEIQDKTLQYKHTSSVNNTTFIHIGKSGGTSLKQSLPRYVSNVHMKKPISMSDTKYIIWVRNPITRFVSAFHHALNLINYDTKNETFEGLFYNSNTPFFRLKNKINSKLKHGNPFVNEPPWLKCDGVRYMQLIKHFKTPNTLAESLTSTDDEEKRLALELMNCECEHIHKGLGWYLDNGEFVEKNHNNILMVGRMEYMNQDIKKLSVILGKNIKTHKNRTGNYSNSIQLSKLAKSNIKEYYKSTDYAALDTLYKYNLLSEETVIEYGQIY